MKLGGLILDGGLGRNRIGMPSRAADFESCELLGLQRDSGVGTVEFIDDYLGYRKSSGNRIEAV